MPAFKFNNVCLESFAINLPTQEVTSAEIEDRLVSIYERLEVPFGTLEKLSGVKSRFLWSASESPSRVGTFAAREALEIAGLATSQIGAIFNCSVSRDFFEPATAVLIHRNLGFSESVMALDVTNACIGFSNGISLLGNLIESGVLKAGIVVSGENVSRIIECSNAALMANKEITREALLKMLPTFTLGCGAVAFVLCHESISKNKHHIRGCFANSASEFSDLCIGNADFCVNQSGDINPIMHTESALLIASAAKLGGRTWTETSKLLGWSADSLQHIFCHQVGKQVGEAFYREMALPIEKEFTIYRKYGNMVSAAMPTAFVLGTREREIKKGDKILLTAFGSGLNSIFTGIEW